MPRQRPTRPFAAQLLPIRQSARLKRRRDEAAANIRPAGDAEDAPRTSTKKQKTLPRAARADPPVPEDARFDGPAAAAAAAAAADDAPDLTDGFVRRLLPGAFFGLADALLARGLWGVAHERALRQQQFAASPDFARFRAAQARLARQPQQPLAAELQLWAVLQHRFRCGLDDLFRYGLRPALGAGVEAADDDDDEDDGAAFAQYCAKLTAVLTHPLWAADIAPVRWILQRIVQERVPGHARPLVPPYSHCRPAFVDTARQWAFDAAMRMGLAGAAGQAGGDGDGDGDGQLDPLFARLATASRDAARAAAAAEAELAWFLFAASAPRDLWWLDRQLVHLYEPGGAGMDAEDEEDEDSRQDSGGSGGSGGSAPNPHGLAVCEDIRLGYFGGLAPSYAGDELSERQDQRRREDNLTHRLTTRAARAARATRARQAAGPPTRFADADLRDDQVFFDLRVQDLDRLLRLLALPAFLAQSGFAAPACYAAGYVKAHALYGYGCAAGAPPAPADRPWLTCAQCLQRYHQSDGDNRDGDDRDGDDRDGDDRDDHDDSRPPSPHGHFLHQHFVADVDPPARALEWLLHRKCEWLLAGVREQMIRQGLAADEDAAAAAAAAADPDGRLLLLPDIPAFDPPVLGHLDRVFTHPSQLAVMRRLPAAAGASSPSAAALWCLGGRVAPAAGA